MKIRPMCFRAATLATLVLVGTPVGPALAYEVETHMLMTEYAAEHSNLVTRLPDLGFDRMSDRIADVTVASESATVFGRAINCAAPVTPTGKRSIAELLELGAYCEDAAFDGKAGKRFFKHFYDPAHDGDGLLFVTRRPSSLVWGLEEPVQSDDQDYSYRDAKTYLHRALTSQVPSEMQENWSLAFRSIGHLTHLLQDLAQPQHTRDDRHAAIGSWGGSVFESYANDEVVRSALELGGYDASQLRVSKLADLWHTSDYKGLADYSNRNFVTEGTNFTGTLADIQHDPNYSEPSGTNATIRRESVAELRSQCPGSLPPYLHGDLLFVSTPVMDYVTGESAINPRTSTFSMWSDKLDAASYVLKFGYNRFNACAANTFLAKRSVAYSAAAINYMFRGELTVSVPPSGIYAIIDHSTFSGTNTLENYTGFGKVRVRVRNSSPPLPGESEREAMDAGTLNARFRFHRNYCYLDTLGGQWGAGMDPLTCRSATEQVIVSDPVQTVMTNQDQEVTFEFNHGQLPINATDVHLQIIYKGPLGDESDAVVVKSIDVSEPSFFSYYNAYDYIAIDDVVYTRDQVNASPTDLLARIQPQACVNRAVSPPVLKSGCFEPEASTVEFRFQSASLPTVQVTSLPARRFVRFAFLSDGQPVTAGLPPAVTANLTGGCNKPVSVWPTLYTFATDSLTGQLILRVSPVAKQIRGVYASSALACVWDGGGNPAEISPSNNDRLGILPASEQLPLPVQVTLPQ